MTNEINTHFWLNLQLPDGYCLRIPLTPASQQSLLAAAAESSETRLCLLEASLRVDPLLLFWSACEFAIRQTRKSESFSELCCWLNESFFEVFVSSIQTSPADSQTDKHWSTVTEQLLLRIRRSVLQKADGHSDSQHRSDSQTLLAVSHAPELVAKQSDDSTVGLQQTLEKLLGPSTPAAPNDPVTDRVVKIAKAAAVSLWDVPTLPADIWQLLFHRLRNANELEATFAETVQTEKLKSMRELAYGCSHEVNNPLANISSRAQTLLRTEKDPEKRRQLATINSQAFRAFEMIANLMLFAKPPNLNLASADLTELITKVVDGFQSDAADQGTELTYQVLGDAVVKATVDVDQISVAVYSLIRNSLESLQQGGHVSVTLSRNEDDRIAVTVQDDGPGIPEDVRPHLFDPFYSGREAGRGLGFGLSKCWTIAQMHGGSVIVSTADNDVTAFTLLLPAETAKDLRIPEPTSVRSA